MAVCALRKYPWGWDPQPTKSFEIKGPLIRCRQHDSAYAPIQSNIALICICCKADWSIIEVMCSPFKVSDFPGNLALRPNEKEVASDLYQFQKRIKHGERSQFRLNSFWVSANAREKKFKTISVLKQETKLLCIPRNCKSAQAWRCRWEV